MDFALQWTLTTGQIRFISIFEQYLCHAVVVEASEYAGIFDDMRRNLVIGNGPASTLQKFDDILQLESLDVVQGGLEHVDEPWVAAEMGKQGLV